jgi:hypothetical protein
MLGVYLNEKVRPTKGAEAEKKLANPLDFVVTFVSCEGARLWATHLWLSNSTQLEAMKYRKLVSVILFALSSAGAPAVVFTTPIVIGPENFIFDGQDITISSCVVTINGFHSFASLHVIAGGVLTHAPAAAGQPFNRIDLAIAADVLIDPFSKIDVSFKGYGPGFPGPGAGVSGTGYTDYGSGGAYGGFGADASSGALGGRPYGSLSQPMDWGSAGGACPSHEGLARAGGGAVRLVAGGTIIIDGQILANGDSDGVIDEVEVGGGAGGSVWLSTPILAGIGSIMANGGAGDIDADGGGGGGGRIALYYGVSTFAGRVQARASFCSFPGGAGTIYTKIIGQTDPLVVVDNGGIAGVGTGVSSSESLWLTATNGGIVAAMTSLNLRGLHVSTKAGVTTADAGSRLNLSVQGDVLIDQGGTVTVDGKGYPVGSNHGPGAAPNATSYAGGASYAGRGGSGYYGAPAGGVTYGSITQPLDFGSAGGTGNGEPGSAGGGAMQMAVTGTLTLNGTITANGISDTPAHGGCGSGGSILLNIGTLQGSGSISANGGSGRSDCDGGAGGGGRIAIYCTNHTTFSFADQVFALGGGPFTCPSQLWGGAGTIYFENASQSGELLVENGGHLGPMTPVTVSGLWRLTVSSNAVVDLTRGATVTSLHLGPDGVLTADSILELTVQGDADLDPGSALTVDGKGYPIGSNRGPGTAPDSAGYAAGGSYGGEGGSGWSSAPVGTPYGSLLQPAELGSAGGTGSTEPGSAGGGAIRLTVAGALAVNGTVSANGVSDNPGHGGSGSGGSIWLTTGTLRGSGTILANGGTGRSDCDGGAGGGGRIALYYNTASLDFTTQVFARGGGPFTCPNRLWGGAGTIYSKSAAQAIGDLRIDNGGNLSARTPVTSPEAFNLTVLGGAIATASHGLTLTSLHIGTNSTLMDLPGDPSLDVLVLNTAVLDAGSVMTVDVTGYPVGTNRGPGAAPDSTGYAGGGGYGGPGGLGFYGAPGGITYGSATQPVDLGSAGGVGSGDLGTAGGGAIRFTVSGSLAHNGLISANGGSNPPTHGGCGSGGSIWLTATSLSGQGLITAAGGTGLAGCDGGSGGGGRVAIYYGSLTGFNPATQASSPRGGPISCPALLGGTGTVFTAAMTTLPALAVLSSSPKSGLPRPWVDYIDLVFNMAINPATFSSADVTITTPLGSIPSAQLILSNLGGTRWRITFPRQSANGAYQYTVGPQIANDSGTQMAGTYVGGFSVSQSAAANRITFATQNSALQLSIPSLTGLNYQILRSIDLINWESLGPVITGNDSPLNWSVPTDDLPQAYLRIQITDAP